MSFFSKLFKKKDDSKEKKVFKARAPRLHADVLEHIEFKMHTQGGDVVVPLMNISTTGLAFKPPGQLFTNEFDATIKIDQNSFSVKLAVIHQLDLFLGCRFTNTSEIFEKAFKSFFKYQLMAGEFLKVKKEALNQPDEGEAHWYYDRSDNEVYFIQKGTSILYFHMSIEGKYIEGGEGKSLRTATLSDENNRELREKSSKAVKYDSPVDPEVIRIGQNLLANLGGLCDGEFSLLSEMLKKGQ